MNLCISLLLAIFLIHFYPKENSEILKNIMKSEIMNFLTLLSNIKMSDIIQWNCEKKKKENEKREREG